MLTAMVFQPVASFAVDSESLQSAEGKTQAQHSDSEPNTAPITVKRICPISSVIFVIRIARMQLQLTRAEPL